MDTLIRGFREHAVQGTAGSLKTGREGPAPPRTVPMLHTQMRVTRTLSLSEYFSSGMETATQLEQPLCTPGWMGDQWQLPASQGEASRRSMPLDKRRRRQPESSHGTPQGSARKHHEQSPRAGENELPGNCAQQSRLGRQGQGLNSATDKPHRTGVDEEATKKGTRKKTFKKKAGRTKLGIQAHTWARTLRKSKTVTAMNQDEARARGHGGTSPETGRSAPCPGGQAQGVALLSLFKPHVCSVRFCRV